MSLNNSKNFYKKVPTIVNAFVHNARQELYQRWKNWKIDLSKPEQYEVIGGLLARQVTLASQLALAPSIWNGHIAPIVLRSMADNYIALAWIFVTPEQRAIKFVEYGLGQEKLQIEHRKEELENIKDERKKEIIENEIEFREEWLESQKFAFLTEVNVGAWSGKSTRAMAEDADEKHFYDFVYTPFSAATHNMWHHVARYNLIQCDNPLHRYHRIPIDPDLEIDPNYLYNAAKYLDKAFRLFDEKTGVKVKVPCAFDILIGDLSNLSEKKQGLNNV